MADKTNNCTGILGSGNGCVKGGTIECGTCICTDKIFDSVKIKECLEDIKVHLTDIGQDAVDRANNIRAKSAEILKACLSVSEVAFNRGYYSVSIRYYFRITFEACIPGGRSTEFCGVAVYDKNLVLYGGEGGVSMFTSDANGGSFCECNSFSEGTVNTPKAVLEAANPVVLDVKVAEKAYNYGYCCCVCEQIPDYIASCVNGTLTDDAGNKNLYITLGVFSIVRMQRPSCIMVQASDYCIPEKDSGTLGDSTSSPCDIFNNMCFPIDEFCPPAPPCCHDTSANAGCRPGTSVQGSTTGNCGCHGNSRCSG